MQNRLVRYITFSPPQTNVNHKYKSLNILSIDQLYFCEMAKFIQSVHNNTSPTIFHDYFQTASHTYHTRFRHNSNYALPQPRTERGKQSCTYKGVNIWAKVPMDMKKLSKESFKFRIKQYVIKMGFHQDK